MCADQKWQFSSIFFARLWQAAVDTTFSSLCTVPASSLSINAAVAFSPWSNRYYLFYYWERRGRNSIKRTKKFRLLLLTTLRKIYLKLSFLVGTHILFHWFVVLVGRWLQYWYDLLWPFLFPKIQKKSGTLLLLHRFTDNGRSGIFITIILLYTCHFLPANVEFQNR